jgi:hypothetical protein
MLSQAFEKLKKKDKEKEKEKEKSLPANMQQLTPKQLEAALNDRARALKVCWPELAEWLPPVFPLECSETYQVGTLSQPAIAAQLSTHC